MLSERAVGLIRTIVWSVCGRVKRIWRLSTKVFVDKYEIIRIKSSARLLLQRKQRSRGAISPG